jgi:hypothetical protein
MVPKSDLLRDHASAPQEGSADRPVAWAEAVHVDERAEHVHAPGDVHVALPKRDTDADASGLTNAGLDADIPPDRNNADSNVSAKSPAHSPYKDNAEFEIGRDVRSHRR